MLTRALKYFHWQLGRLLEALDRDKKKYHEASIKFRQLMAANNKQVFDQMYSDPALLQHYLVESRLDFYRKVVSKIVDHFPGDIRAADCLDVGCGTGHLLSELRGAGFLGRLVGLDSSSAAEERVLSHDLGLEFYAGYLAEQGWHGEFDLILCTEVLEHCDHPADIVLSMIEAVRRGGVIVITVPDGRKDTWEGHIHFWSPESFKLFMEGFHKKVAFDYFDDTNFCVLYC